MDLPGMVGAMTDDGRFTTSPGTSHAGVAPWAPGRSRLLTDDPRPIAFFDLDGTLVAGQTQKMLVAFMRKRALVPAWFLAGTALWFLGYKFGLVEANDQARERGAVLFADRTVEEVGGLMEEFFEERLAPRLFVPVLAELEHHLGAGRRVVLLSAAFTPLVEVTARRLGVQEFVATDLEVTGGRFTGRVLGSPVYGAEKAAVAAGLLGGGGARAEKCFAYADHDTDLELLQLVGQPVAVRPRAGLRRRPWGTAGGSCCRGRPAEWRGHRSGVPRGPDEAEWGKSERVRKGDGFENMSIDEKAINTIRMLAVDAVEKANSGHPGMPMGTAPIAHLLWSSYLKFDPGATDWPDRDRFVLSAGHGSMLLYSMLHLTGYDLEIEDLQQFRQWGSRTPGHPENFVTPGVEVTTGPLGQGFANGVGMAMAERWLAATFNRSGHEIVDHRVYGIVSDGDLMEGISHEAASLAGHLQLGKLIYFYDSNKISIDGSTEQTFTEDVSQRFEAYAGTCRKWMTVTTSRPCARRSRRPRR